MDGGVPYYSLTFNGTLIVDNSRLGINTDKFLFSDQLKVIKVKRRSQNKSWEQVWGEQKIVQDNHNELELTLLCTVEKNKMILRFRIFNDGIGFRYEIPEQGKISDFTILDELTEFNLAEDSPSWWINAFARKSLSKEQSEAQIFLKTLLNWRKNSLPIAKGRLIHYPPKDGVYAYFRSHGDELVMVLVNNNSEAVNIDLKRFYEVLDKRKQARSVISSLDYDLREKISIKEKTALILDIIF
jgi:hypothetical protein